MTTSSSTSAGDQGDDRGDDRADRRLLVQRGQYDRHASAALRRHELRRRSTAAPATCGGRTSARWRRPRASPHVGGGARFRRVRGPFGPVAGPRDRRDHVHAYAGSPPPRGRGTPGRPPRAATAVAARVPVQPLGDLQGDVERLADEVLVRQRHQHRPAGGDQLVAAPQEASRPCQVFLPKSWVGSISSPRAAPPPRRAAPPAPSMLGDDVGDDVVVGAPGAAGCAAAAPPVCEQTMPGAELRRHLGQRGIDARPRVVDAGRPRRRQASRADRTRARCRR